MNNNDNIRINKYISSTGICSRREADKLIAQGKITINNKKAQIGNVVNKSDCVKIDGKPVFLKKTPIYIALNKPTGIVCTTDKKEKYNIVDFINYHERIFPIGRLDKDSQGLILLTNDGDIVNKILRSGNNHEKEYIVTVDKKITKDFIKSMSRGVRILGTITKKCIVTDIDSKSFRIILTEGMNRQIRRMCAVFDYEVVSLKRIRIMNISLADLPIGYWRLFTGDELDYINKLISHSTKTEEGSKKC